MATTARGDLLGTVIGPAKSAITGMKEKGVLVADYVGILARIFVCDSAVLSMAGLHCTSVGVD